MKANAMTSTSTDQNQAVKRQSHVATFAKVLDGRKQPIRGLWVRNGRYYAQLTIEDSKTGNKSVRRVPLLDKEQKPVDTAAQAVAAFDRLKVNRTDDALPVLIRTPKFSDFADKYLTGIKIGEGTKKAGTIEKEESHLRLWKKHLGSVRLDKIKKIHVLDFREKRLESGVSARTVNLDVIAFRNVMKRAIDDGWIQLLPTHGLRPLKVKTVKKNLFTTAELDAFCKAAFNKRTNDKGELVPVSKNAVEFVDYIKLMAYSGARRNEALALRWNDVDFEKGQLTIGADGDTKNSTARTVDFNPMLRAHLTDMATRLAPDSQWLFPSPQRGERDVHVQTFRESLTLARTQAKMLKFNFHDLRHHFISMAVMSGIDYMTIAAWVGHKDGGVLIGKVYGHLADTHKKAMAEKMTFQPVPSAAIATSSGSM
jgi:integrase